MIVSQSMSSNSPKFQLWPQGFGNSKRGKDSSQAVGGLLYWKCKVAQKKRQREEENSCLHRDSRRTGISHNSAKTLKRVKEEKINKEKNFQESSCNQSEPVEWTPVPLGSIRAYLRCCLRKRAEDLLQWQPTTEWGWMEMFFSQA